MLKQLKNTPLINLSPKEFEEAFDNIGLPLDRVLLEDARAGRSDSVQIAMAILERPGEPDRVIYCDVEAGDNAGIDNMRDFAAGCRRQSGLLKPEERIRIDVRRIPWNEMQLVRCQGSW